MNNSISYQSLSKCGLPSDKLEKILREFVLQFYFFHRPVGLLILKFFSNDVIQSNQSINHNLVGGFRAAVGWRSYNKKLPNIKRCNDEFYYTGNKYSSHYSSMLKAVLSICYCCAHSSVRQRNININCIFVTQHMCIVNQAYAFFQIISSFILLYFIIVFCRCCPSGE